MATVCIGLATMLTAAMAAAPAQAAPAKPNPAPAAQAVSAPVTGTFTDALGGSGTMTGTFRPTHFVVSGSQLLAQGLVTANLVDSANQPVGSTSQTVSLPVVLPSAAEAAPMVACQILNLVLGPLDLNLLGLVVHLDTVHLNITAQSGPGNLLGNLLCAIAGLLNGAPNLGVLSALLNVLLGLLNL